jgi:hypothetical protein
MTVQVVAVSQMQVENSKEARKRRVTSCGRAREPRVSRLGIFGPRRVFAGCEERCWLRCPWTRHNQNLPL